MSKKLSDELKTLLGQIEETRSRIVTDSEQLARLERRARQLRVQLSPPPPIEATIEERQREEIERRRLMDEKLQLAKEVTREIKNRIDSLVQNRRQLAGRLESLLGDTRLRHRLIVASPRADPALQPHLDELARNQTALEKGEDRRVELCKVITELKEAIAVVKKEGLSEFSALLLDLERRLQDEQQNLTGEIAQMVPRVEALLRACDRASLSLAI